VAQIRTLPNAPPDPFLSDVAKAKLWLSRPPRAGGADAAPLPARIGPVEFSTLGALVAVHCPSDLDPLMLKAGGLWEPGAG
jgi:hypothetical protein